MQTIAKTQKTVANGAEESLTNVDNLEDESSMNIALQVPTEPVITLKPHQEKAVEKLKQLKNQKSNDPQIKDGQILAFLQGTPGSGKTTIAKCLAQKLGLNILFAGTTSTAAAQLQTDTINTILGLGLNQNDIKQTEVPYGTKQKIVETTREFDMLSVDEISMLTPVTLAKIELYTRASIDEQYHLGGKDFLAIGDLWQFNPVAPGLHEPALFQALVNLGLGKKMPNDAYRVGAELFSKFTLIELDGQVRACPKYDKFLAQLRNPAIEYPITDEWLDELPIISAKDFQQDIRNWTSTSIVVSGNMERRAFIAKKSQKFAEKNGQPVLRWTCPVKISNQNYELLPFDPEGIYDELIYYFVPGAPCVLTESINPRLGLGKGAEGIFIDIVYEHDNINYSAFPAGQITTIPQPDYIVVQIGEHTVVLKKKIKQLKDKNGKYRSYCCRMFRVR